MDDADLRFERPMPAGHRIAYCVMGAVAVAFGTWMAWRMLEPGEGSAQTEAEGWRMVAVILAAGVPLVAAAVLGGHSEVSIHRRARVLRDVAWVGPLAAWRTEHPFKDLGMPRVLSGADEDGAGFRIEIPVKTRVDVTVATFATRAEAETALMEIRAALDPNELPPRQPTTVDQLRSKLGAIFVQGPR